MDVQISSPQHIDYHYDVVDGPIVPTWDDRSDRRMRVTSVEVTYIPSTDEVQARARGYIVRANGELDRRFNTLESADNETDRAYAVAWVRSPEGLQR